MTESTIRQGGEIERLYEALAMAQGEFTPIRKTKHAVITAREGKRGYEYNYAELSDVNDATRPALAKFGLLVVQPTRFENGALLVVTHIGHRSGAWMESDYPVASVAGGFAHPTVGGALTYARRYALCSMLNVSGEDDVDSAGEGMATQVSMPAAQPPRRTPAAAQAALDPTQSHGGAAASGTGDTTPTTGTATKKKSLVDPADPLIVSLKENLANWETLRRWHETNRPLILARDEAWQNDFYALYDFRASELKKAAGLVETPKT